MPFQFLASCGTAARTGCQSEIINFHLVLQVDPHSAGGGGERAHAPPDLPGAQAALCVDAHVGPLGPGLPLPAWSPSTSLPLHSSWLDDYGITSEQRAPHGALALLPSTILQKRVSGIGLDALHGGISRG